ncbi:MAG: hypothetical protein M0036_07915 [Desulfobacteraceae bacterium]|nr:hypothetical protein [Desulfobacteraceae bacterium]
MNPKRLLFLTWIFYLLERRTADELWSLLMIYSSILALCAYFYQKDNRKKSAQKNKPA